MSPSDLEVLIHYHCSKSNHPRYDSPAVIEATDRFLNDGIIEVKSNLYTITEKGKSWLAMILKTPYPTQCWVDDYGDRIEL